MVFTPLTSLKATVLPRPGTKFQLALARDIETVNGQYMLKAGKTADTILFLGLSPDRKRIEFKYEDGTKSDISITGPYYVEQLLGGGRRTRKGKRKTYRKRSGTRKHRGH